MMKVSVIVPALNEAATIAMVLRCAREAGADELVVADGGSVDGTREAANGTADAVVVTPPGRGRQMNAGTRASTGDALLFLHADTVIPPGSIGSVRTALARKDVVGGGFRVRLGTSPGAPISRRIALRVTGWMINARSRIFRTFTGDQAIFLRRELFDRIGGYPEIPLMEDVELSRAMTRRGRTVLLSPRIVTSARRWESDGTARTILRMWFLRIAYRFGMSSGTCARLYRGRGGNR